MSKEMLARIMARDKSYQEHLDSLDNEPTIHEAQMHTGALISEALDEKSIEEHNAKNNKLYHPSRFGFLMAHHGIRPGCLHGYLGTMGSGKSTMGKAIVAELAEGAKVLVYLTEETIAEYQAGINKINPHILPNIRFIEQRELKTRATTPAASRDYLRMALRVVQPKAFFIDNMTTSPIYGEHIHSTEQAKTIDWLKDTGKEMGHATFYIAHTKKEVTDNMPRLMTPEDIRGNNMLPIVTEYFYTAQKFTGNTKQYTVVNICKHRHHPDATGYFLLHYDNGKYLKDSKVSFDDINKIFKGRDQLGKRSGPQSDGM